MMDHAEDSSCNTYTSGEAAAALGRMRFRRFGGESGIVFLFPGGSVGGTL